jgi:hypothetical protein
LKNKYEEICRLQSLNKKLLDKVGRLKEQKKNCQNKEERRILDEESIKNCKRKFARRLRNP